MHEASLISSLMRRIDEAAKNERARKVVGVTVWIGALSHISAEHFAEHFERAAAGGVAEGARLEVTVSNDVAHASAQDVLLEKIEVED
jgi:hydrogenase nickel incorporation protein HypA/HybF